MIDLPSNRGSSITNTTPAQSVSKPANQQSVAAGIQLLKQIQQGQTLAAEVLSVKTLSTAEKSLLQQSNPGLAQQLTQKLSQLVSQQHSLQTANKPVPQLLNQTTSHLPVKQSLTNQSLANNINTQILTKTSLYLVKLLVNQSSSKPIALTTVTPEPLTAKQQLLVSQNNQQLVFTQSKNQQLENIVSQTYKNTLPKQQDISQLQQLSQRLFNLPETVRNLVLPKTTLENLSRLSNFTYSHKELNNAQALRQAFTNSGIQLENKLGKQQNIHQDLRFILDKLAQSLTPKSNDNQSLRNQSLTNQTTDNKTTIITKELEKLLTNLIPQQSSAATGTGSSQTSTPPPLANSTALLFRLLGIPVPMETKNLDIPKIVQAHIKFLLEQTQAKIELNQLRSLFTDKPSNENRGLGGQQFHTEIALRFNEQIVPLQISIYEQDAPEGRDEKESQENKDNDEEKNITRRWQVNMSFDLPTSDSTRIDKLHSQLILIDDNVSATLWAESQGLCNKTQQHIHRLRDKLIANGLSVEDLTCLLGKPTQQDFSLDYNLIDITT